MSQCKEEETKPEPGSEQIQPPVLNSGAETERTRALEAVERDTTNKEVHVGKDAEGVKTGDKKRDSTPQ